MKLSLFAATAALAFVAAACTTGGGATPSASSGGGAAVTLSVAHTSPGDTLAGAGGKTLYTNTKEKGGTIACKDACVSTWPPLTGTATAGSGVTGTLGTITRPDGGVQVTYNGSPLYYYSGDSAAGQANGQGIGGIWYIASPTGAGSSSSTPPASSGGGGY